MQDLDGPTDPCMVAPILPSIVCQVALLSKCLVVLVLCSQAPPLWNANARSCGDGESLVIFSHISNVKGRKGVERP